MIRNTCLNKPYSFWLRLRVSKTGSANANANASVFAFGPGANNITLDHLSITGAQYGVYVNYGTGAANNTISNDAIFGNGSYGYGISTTYYGTVTDVTPDEQ